MDKINETTGVKKKLMLDALKVGKEYNIDCLMNGKEPSAMLKLKYKFYEKTIYSLLKKTIGIENGNFFPTAGAAIPPKVGGICKVGRYKYDSRIWTYGNYCYCYMSVD